MMPEGVERRLRAHVARVLAHADLLAHDRDDVAEELFGHLIERWRALTDGGMEPMRAAQEAVRSFGSARRIGGELTQSFRGRFWAATIGVLLPVARPRGPRPRIAWWLGGSLWIYGTLAGIAAVLVAAESPPVRGLLVLGFGLGAGATYLLAAAALARRQRWGLDVAVIANVIGLVTGVVMMLTTPGLISLNVFFSGGLLLIAATEGAHLRRWVRRSRSMTGALAIAIGATILGGALLPVAGRDIPDPTQARPEDLHVDLAIDCQSRDVVLTADVRWDRTSLLPGGLANLRQYGDVLVLDQSTEETWRLDNLPTLVNRSTGQVVAQPDEAYAPNQERTIQALRALHTIQISWNALDANTTYRATWVFSASEDVETPEPLQVAVEYIHADRFRWESLIDCYRGVHEPFVSDWP